MLSQRMTGYKYPTLGPNGVTCWICANRCRIVAKKGNDSGARFPAYGDQIEFPFDDRLIDYPQ